MSQQINLYDAAFRQQEKPFSAAAMAVSLTAIALAFITAHVYLASQVRRIEEALRQSDKALTALRDQVALLASQSTGQGGALLVEELARSEARLKARRELLQDITTRVAPEAEGYSALMTGLARRTVQGVWLTGFSVGDNRRLEIKGGVLDAKLVPAYMRSLNDEESIRGRNVTELALTAREDPAKSEIPSQRPLRYVEFTVKLAPKGATDTESAR